MSRAVNMGRLLALSDFVACPGPTADAFDGPAAGFSTACGDVAGLSLMDIDIDSLIFKTAQPMFRKKQMAV